MVTGPTARVLGVLAVSAGVLVACQVIVGIDPVDKVKPSAPVEGGTSGTSGGTSGALPDPCEHVLPPGPPKDEESGPEVAPLFLVTREMRLTTQTGSAYQGFDLDRSCTCETRPGTAFEGKPSCTAPSGQKPICDPDGGIDNKGAELFTTLSTFGVKTDEGLKKDIDAGNRGVVFYLRGWNGKPNDLVVEVGVFVTYGLLETDREGNHPPPRWDGTDVWTYPPDIVNADSTRVTPAVLAPGYVSGGQLVIQTGSSVSIVFGKANLTFNEALVVGGLTTLDAGQRRYKLDGALGGRISSDSLLRAAGRIESEQVPICKTPTLMALAKSQICGAVDLNPQSALDFKEGKVCTAISSAIAFSAESALIPPEAARKPDAATEDVCAGVSEETFKCSP